MDEELLKRSLQDIELELQDLESKIKGLEALQNRRNQIYHLVTQMRFTLGLGPYSPPADPVPGNVPGLENSVAMGAAFQSAPRIIAETTRQMAEVFKSAGSNATELLGPPKKAIWEYARDILGQAKRPMSLEEIVEALRGFGLKLSGRSGRETVRAILFKKPEVFERTEDRKYCLK